MRILFAGSPGIAVPALEALASLCADAAGDFTLAGLLTNPDTPKKRSGNPEPTECAAALYRLLGEKVPVIKPEKLDSAAREQTAALKPDLLVSFAYGRFFGPKFLGLFPMGGINIHPSLLPKYRGPTPIPAAIIGKEHETGITIQRLIAETDSGDIIVQEKVSLNGRETTAVLSDIMAEKAAVLLPAVLKKIACGNVNGIAQDPGAATYCSLINKEEGFINWNMSAVDIDARIRAFSPWPLSWTMHGNQQLLILKANCIENGKTSASPGQVLGKDSDLGILIQTGDGVLAVSELQYQSKKALEWKTFLNGARNFIGTQLG